MKLLADENFPKNSIEILANAGFDIISVGSDYLGIEDAEVIQISIEQNRTIITFDRDYGELIFKKGLKPVAGVIYLRWDNFDPKKPGKYLVKLFKSQKISFENRLTVIGVNTIRQRKYF
jgi:predicted nuclease of predicted toxin-antitoxin system